MEIEITRKGVYAPIGKNKADKEIEVGTVIDLGTDEIPASLVNKCREVKKVEDTPDVQIAKPPSAQERQSLLKGVAISMSVEAFNQDGTPKVSAVNAELEADAKFDAAEVGSLWPGVKDAVEAERAAKVQS